MSAIGYLENDYILNNKYRIIRKLGEGGFAITYLAEELTLNKRVAIKEFMPREHANRSQTDNSISPYTDKIDIFNHLIKKFREEARLLVGLKHPNIVRVWELLEANNTIYMVMEYEEGEDLKSYLEKYTKLNEDEIINIMNPVFEAIKYVHSKNILHKDIAPDNIYMRKNGTPMVIDFGSARDLIAKYSKIPIVKAGYSPPEQYSTTNQSPPTDIYALGAVLYRMMSGKNPISSLVRQNLLYEQDKEPLENIATLCKKRYSKNLTDVVNKAMNLKTQDRFQTIDEMQRALFQGVTPTPQPSPRPTPQPRPVRPLPNNNNLKMVLGLLGLIVIVFSIFLFKQYKDENNYTEPISDSNITYENNNTEDNITKEVETNESFPQISNLTTEEVKPFYNEFLKKSCLDSESEVGEYFASNVVKYFDFSHPSHEQIYQDRNSFCENYIFETDIDSTDISIIKSDQNGFTADISNDYIMMFKDGKKNNRLEFGSFSNRVDFTKEDGVIKISSIEQQTLNRRSDEYKKYAYKLITSTDVEDEMAINSIECLSNTKNDIVFCLTDRSMCKNFDEVKQYMNNN